jgi:hypothetical protein
MATLTYTVYSGELSVCSDDGSAMVIAFCKSGFSNLPWNSQ